MMDPIRNWYRRQFEDPRVVILLLALVAAFTVGILAAKMLPAVLISIIVAYLLEGQVSRMDRNGIPRKYGVTIAFTAFLILLFGILVGVLPPLLRQAGQLLQELPIIIGAAQDHLLRLPELYPNAFSHDQILELIRTLRTEATKFGQQILTQSFDWIPSLIAVLVYLILVPLLVYFFLADKQIILGWMRTFLPHNRDLASSVWHEVDMQIGNYVRGKFWEILIIGTVSTLSFLILGLNYAILLGALVGLSVLIPYIGATVMTIPVVVIALVQWGPSTASLWTITVYLIIQALDGNFLVPFLFSEIVNLHPVAIIVSVLFFGQLWGFWGVFFAIPLATVVKAVINAWPKEATHASVPPSKPPA